MVRDLFVSRIRALTVVLQSASLLPPSLPTPLRVDATSNLAPFDFFSAFRRRKQLAVLDHSTTHRPRLTPGPAPIPQARPLQRQAFRPFPALPDPTQSDERRPSAHG
jgi:hypothetical protein